MSELIKKNCEDNKGKDITIFLLNGFTFKGRLLEFDDVFIEIFDYRSQRKKTFRIDTIKEFDWEGKR